MIRAPRHPSAGLSHLDARGNARMVDVGDKPVTSRRARARATVRLGDAFEVVRDGAVPKGDVLAIARLAGIMGAKETSRLVPLCHPLPLSGVELELELVASTRSLLITCSVRTEARTGVEMEALTGATVAALAAWDTCKSVTKDLAIESVVLLEKEGGRSGRWTHPSAAPAATVTKARVGKTGKARRGAKTKRER